VAELADFVERGVATFGDKGIGGGGAAAGKWSGGVVVTEFEKQKAKERKEAARKKPAIPEEVCTCYSYCLMGQRLKIVRTRETRTRALVFCSFHIRVRATRLPKTLVYLYFFRK